MKLSKNAIRSIIKEEASKLDSDLGEDKPEVTDADEYADTVEKQVDFVKALKIEEARLMKRTKQIRENIAKAMKKLQEKI